jgi:hypothetical protein
VGTGPGSCITGIRGAGISVIAVLGRSGNADTAGTQVVQGAGIAVITGRCIVGVYARAGDRVAAVIRAGISIIARNRDPGTDPVGTRITGCSGIVVITGFGVGHKYAIAGDRIKGIIGAHIPVIARCGRTRIKVARDHPVRCNSVKWTAYDEGRPA